MTGAGEDECGTKMPVEDAAKMDLGVKLKRLQSLRAQIVAARREYWKLTSEEDRHRFFKLCKQLDIGKPYSFLCPLKPPKKVLLEHVVVLQASGIVHPHPRAYMVSSQTCRSGASAMRISATSNVSISV